MPDSSGDVQARLVEASRLSLLGRLLGSVLHQMSTPLGAIALRAESLSRDVEGSGAASIEKRQRYVKAIAEEAQRCQDLVAALRGFAAPGEPGTRIDLVAVCRRAITLAQHEAMRRQVGIELQGEPAAYVIGRSERLGHAVMALLVNGLDASPRGSRVRLQVARSGADVLAVVEDEGEGPPPGLRLFEPFAGSRTAQQGLGLGLMAAQVIAGSHGGAVSHEPSPPRGGRFVLRLPAAE